MRTPDKNTPRKYSLSDYDPSWVSRFEQIRSFLAGVFGAKPLKIDHIGSTSIPGMKAKPVIDVLIVVDTMKSFDTEKKKMVQAGYEWGENYIAPNTLIFYRLGPDGEKLENIHVCEKNAPKVKQFLVKREFFRAFPDKAREYSDLKAENARNHPDDYVAYRTAKEPYLAAIEKEAYEWANGSETWDKIRRNIGIR